MFNRVQPSATAALPTPRLSALQAEESESDALTTSRGKPPPTLGYGCRQSNGTVWLQSDGWAEREQMVKAIEMQDMDAVGGDK